MVRGECLPKAPSSHNSLKITTRKTLLKMFLTSTCITTQLGCKSNKAQMPKMMASQPPKVNTPNWWEDKCSWNNPQSCRTMEWLINRKNTLLMAKEQWPQMSFAIANNMLAPNIMAIDLKISPPKTTTTIWNNSKNPEDGSSNMKHPKRCSYTIPKNPPKDK